ncbi:NADP-dependent oxidoreductase domain-containing protein [Mycena epipterygia]|nr:NADP-dependent oxidoreductase domain-containing protein [Mycena epipterygia]
MREIVLGNAIWSLQLPREEIVVMTKVCHSVLYGFYLNKIGFCAAGKTVNTNARCICFAPDPTACGYVNQYGLSREHIMTSVQDSLKRLQLDYIDALQSQLFYFNPKFGHRFDCDTPMSETMPALHNAVKAGRVRCVGMNSFYAWQIHAMQSKTMGSLEILRHTHNLILFISIQNQYSLVYREEEREMMPSLKHSASVQSPGLPSRVTHSPALRNLRTQGPRLCPRDQRRSPRPCTSASELGPRSS